MIYVISSLLLLGGARMVFSRVIENNLNADIQNRMREAVESGKMKSLSLPVFDFVKLVNDPMNEFPIQINWDSAFPSFQTSVYRRSEKPLSFFRYRTSVVDPTTADRELPPIIKERYPQSPELIDPRTITNSLEPSVPFINQQYQPSPVLFNPRTRTILTNLDAIVPLINHNYQQSPELIDSRTIQTNLGVSAPLIDQHYQQSPELIDPRTI